MGPLPSVSEDDPLVPSRLTDLGPARSPFGSILGAINATSCDPAPILVAVSQKRSGFRVDSALHKIKQHLSLTGVRNLRPAALRWHASAESVARERQAPPRTWKLLRSWWLGQAPPTCVCRPGDGASEQVPGLPTVVGRLAVHGRVVVLGGSDGRLVFGRPVHRRQVFVLVLRNGGGSLLPQDVGQRSERQQRR